MRASIIVASHQEGDRLWRTLASCFETTVGFDREIVVADDASFDGSVEEATRRFPQVRLLRHEERQGASPTKALGAKHARGETLVFLDGHCKAEPGAIARLVEDVERLKGEAIVTPAIAALDVPRWKNAASQVGHGYFLELDEFHCGWLPLGELRGVWKGPRKYYESPALIGCALAVGRELYETLGGFDAYMRYWGVEDLDFGLKSWLMGFPILHDPDAVIGHRFRAAFDNFSVPMEHLLVNQLRMARKNFTDAVWSDWVERCRDRHVGGMHDHPEGLWALAWELFQHHRASVDQERATLLGHRQHDEFWYAEHFGLDWPRLSSSRAAVLPRAFVADASPSPMPSGSPPPPRKTIFISGYWPPTNIEQPDGMLNQFKSATIGASGEYIINDYDGTGYRIVTIATKFPGKGDYVPGQNKDWGGGAGRWQVDYQLTADTFWNLMKTYTPIAVMTTSRRANDKVWLLEIGSTNLKRSDWNVSPDWNVDRPPYIGGGANDPAKDLGPNAGRAPKPGYPPDATENAGFVREVPATVKTLQTTIKDALNAEFTPNQLVADIPTVVQGTAPDNYVSAYAGYLAVWYDAWKDSCKAGWHTHVDYDITLANAAKAIKIQLDELIKWLNTQ